MKKAVIFLLVVLALPISAVYANDSVYLGGDSIGVVGEYEGLYVSGLFPFEIEDKKIDPSQNIQIKDLIIKVNNNVVTDFSTFQTELKKFEDIYNEIPVTLIRNGKQMESTLITSFKNNKVEYGLYMKEKVLGVGTMTFYNPSNQTYGALGHPISSEDNEYLQEGDVYASDITSVSPSSPNDAGEKNGNINYEDKLGDIDQNTNIGIYGNYIQDISEKEKLEIAEANEIHTGAAYFYTVLEGEKVEKFTIEITSIKNDLNDEKAIEFKVNDKGLIERCGGIIHGMSGSPIVQDGKIIAAITHVIMDDPKSGYAIYIKNMYDVSKEMN